MDQNQLFVLALANVPTMIAVLIGIFVDTNARLSDLSRRCDSLENRMTNLDQKVDMRFDVVSNKIDDIDNRLARLVAKRRN